MQQGDFRPLLVQPSSSAAFVLLEGSKPQPLGAKGLSYSALPLVLMSLPGTGWDCTRGVCRQGAAVFWFELVSYIAYHPCYLLGNMTGGKVWATSLGEGSRLAGDNNKHSLTELLGWWKMACDDR
jgi:hypothetical protein